MGTAERQLVLRVMNGAQAPVDPLLLQAIILYAHSSSRQFCKFAMRSSCKFAAGSHITRVLIISVISRLAK